MAVYVHMQGGGLPSTGDISMFSSKPFGGGSMFGAIIGGGLFSFLVI